MAITETLSVTWHSIEDRAWSLADFFEDKGVPVASFCEQRGVSPLLLFGGIILLIILLFTFMGGAGGPAGGATLTVTVIDESENPVASIYVELEYDNGMQAGAPVATDAKGRARFEDLKYQSVTATAESSQYSGSKSITISKASNTLTVPVERLKGTIKAVVKDTAGSNAQGGTLEVKEVMSGTIAGTKPISGAASYEFLVPAAAYYVIVKSTSGGELKRDMIQVAGGRVTDVQFEIPQGAADSASVRVAIRDENGNAVPGAYITLYNMRSDAPIGDKQQADANGESVFSGIAIGTEVYPVVFMANDRRYGQIDTYTGKSLKKRVDSVQTLLNLTLPLNGRADVIVWDKESHGYISGASVYIKSKAGETVSKTKLTGSDGKVSFSGFEENLEVYPVVSSLGYLPYENAQDARPIKYTAGALVTFQTPMERDGSVVLSMISIAVTDIFKDPIKAVNAVLSEPGVGFVRSVKNKDNITFEIDATKLYNVALYKAGYLRKVLEAIGPGTRTAELEAANNANAGEVRVCVSADKGGTTSGAGASVELMLGTGALIDVGSTAGGSDGDSCITFKEVPRGWTVFARASNDGVAPVDSDVTEVIPVQDGITRINITMSSVTANAAMPGDIKVCVTSNTGNKVAGADVILYDMDLDGPSWAGSFEGVTADDGCLIFAGLPTEKTDYQGVLRPVIVYAIVSADGYATYNGKTEGNSVPVQSQRLTPLSVRLNVGQSICIAVESGGEPLAGVTVSLCANGPCTQVLETKSTESDGHAVFTSDVGLVTAKAVADEDSLAKEAIQSFAIADVTMGLCGKMRLDSVTQYATVSLDGIAGMILEAAPGESSEIAFLVRVNDDPATGGVISSGGQSVVEGADGTPVAITLTGDITPGTVRTVDATAGSYALPFIAPDEEGDYQATLEASVVECGTCQGDMRYLTIRVGDGDEDNDGVLDEEDLCPSTLDGASVDSTGCDIASSTDSDSDGVTDDRDQCAGTQPGLRVDSIGCEIEELVDSDGDGVPDEYDAYPSDSTLQYAGQETETTDTGLTDQYDNQQFYQNSVRICTVDQYGVPVYDSSISLSALITASASTTSTSSYSSSSSGYSAYGSGYGAYGSYSAYGGMPSYYQPWQAIGTSDNCRTFVGMSQVSGLSVSTFTASFRLAVNAAGYSPYDSMAGGGELRQRQTTTASTQVTMAGALDLEVVLKRGAGAEVGEGTIINPKRTVELASGSETWKPQTQGRKDALVLYPLLLNQGGSEGQKKSIAMTVNYHISSGAQSSLDYNVKYTITGSRCYKVSEEDEETSLGELAETGGTTSSLYYTGGRTVHFEKGQSTVPDTVTVTSRDECWNSNDPDLESEFTVAIDGELVQVGDQEMSTKTRFMPVRITVKPLVGAVRQISGLSDMAGLVEMLTFSDGVVTSGPLPYCIASDANTGKSMKVSSTGKISGSEAEKKIVVRFKPETLPEDIKDRAEEISRDVRGPTDCVLYVNVVGKYMGYIEVGQRGVDCQAAMSKVTIEGAGERNAQPWEVLFCKTAEEGEKAQIDLGNSYTVAIVPY